MCLASGEFSIVAALAAPSGTVEASSNQVHMAEPEKESASTTADIKLFCTRLSSPARLLQGALVILVFKQTSQFRFFGKLEKTYTIPLSENLHDRVFTEFESAWHFAFLPEELSSLLPDSVEDFCPSP